MISFGSFVASAPAIGEPIRARLTSAGLALLGTVRADGWPRVSPIEVSLVDDRLYMGMMPGSRKLADVTRDPRVCVLTPVADRHDTAGEGKLVGRLVQVGDDEATRVLRAAAEVAGFDPDALAGSPVFELQVAEAAWQHVRDDVFVTLSWRADRPGSVRARERRGAIDAPVDVEAVSEPGRTE